MNAELYEQDWCRDLFLAYYCWLTDRCQAGDLTRRIDNYARFFEVLDREIDRPDLLSQSRLAEVFSPEELRRNFMVVRFLIEVHGIKWEKAKAREAAQARKNQERLDDCGDEPWCAVIHDYCRYLRAKSTGRRGSLNERTVGTYLNAAVGFLRAEGVTCLEELEMDAPSRFARRYPGYTASLGPFLTYLRSLKGVDLEPVAKKPPKRRQFEQRLIREVKVLLERLEVASGQRHARPLIARAISRIYQLPLIEVLAWRWEEVSISGDRVSLFVESETIELAQELARPVSKWLVPGHPGDCVFPGRIPQVPMSSSNVIYHVELAKSGAKLAEPISPA